MREYMLFVIIKNVQKMRKYRQITESIFNKFQLLNATESPQGTSHELASFLA